MVAVVELARALVEGERRFWRVGLTFAPANQWQVKRIVVEMRVLREALQSLCLFLQREERQSELHRQRQAPMLALPNAA